MSDTRHLFQKELGSIHKSSTTAAADELLRPVSEPEGPIEELARALQQGKIQRRDLEAALGELFYGLLRSVLVVVDGGTALAEKGGVRLVDENTGRDLGEGLHELMPGYLKGTRSTRRRK